MGFVHFIAWATTIALIVLAYKFIIPEKRRPKLNKLGQFVHDIFNFKFLVIEKIMQFFYVLSTLSCICYGVGMLFGFDIVNYSYYKHTTWYGWYGILIVILGPIIIRLMYEGIMMGILLVKNVIQINRKLKSQVDDEEYKMPSFKELVAKENFNFKTNNNQSE